MLLVLSFNPHSAIGTSATTPRSNTRRIRYRHLAFRLFDKAKAATEILPYPSAAKEKQKMHKSCGTENTREQA